MYVRFTGIHVLLLLVGLASLASAVLKPSECDIHVTPQVAIAPVTLLHVRTTIEQVHDWRAARVTLYSDSGEETASDIHVDRRTTEFDWKNLNLDEGTYYAHLEVVGQGGARCDAKVSIEAR